MRPVAEEEPLPRPLPSAPPLAAAACRLCR
jgi:hypothetical protein